MLDVEHFGTLAFNSQNRTFEFAAELDGKVIAVDFEPMPGRQLALLLEYDVGKHDTSIRLKVKHFGGSDENRAQGLLSPLERAPGPGVTGMNRRQHDMGWCGAVQNISYGPHKPNSNSWKICSSLIGVAPSTLTADLAFHAALLVDIHPSKKLVRRPTLEQVRKFADVSVAFLYPGRRRRERGDPYLPNPAVEWLEKEFGPTQAKRVAKDAAR